MILKGRQNKCEIELRNVKPEDRGQVERLKNSFYSSPTNKPGCLSPNAVQALPGVSSKASSFRCSTLSVGSREALVTTFNFLYYLRMDPIS
jgi:hypothetical protein